MMMLLLALLGCSPSTEDIARNLQSANPAVRVDTAKIARNFGSDGVEKALIDALDDEIEQVQVHAIESLAELEAMQAAPALIAMVAAEEAPPRVLQAAVDTLGRLGDSEAVPTLIAYLEAREQTTLPLNAIWALGFLEDHRGLDVLSRLRDSKDPYVRWNANQALRNLRPPPATD